MLTVVQHKQQPPGFQHCTQMFERSLVAGLWHPEYLGEGFDDQFRPREWTQFDEPRAGGKCIERGGGRAQSQARLARPPRPGEGDEAVFTQQARDFRQLTLTTDEAGDIRG